MLLRRILRPIKALILGICLVSCIHFDSKADVNAVYLADPMDLDLATEFYFDHSDQGDLFSTDCYPQKIISQLQMDIYFQHCSSRAFELEGQDITLASGLEIPSAFNRRFNFWKKIWGHYTYDHFVLHLAPYPEVILEIGKLAKMDQLGWHQKRKVASDILTPRKELYRSNLRKMHLLRETPEKFSPAMKRIAGYMSHIPDPNKYQIAAQGVRTQRGQKDELQKGLSRSSRYIKAIAEEFDNKGVAPEFSKLAYVESSFNLNARSKSGAVGVYQLMPATAKQYFLRMTDDIDERKDPIKAARTAAKLLKLNYKLSKSWPLAITAYNHGIGSIRRAIRSLGTNDYTSIVLNYKNKQFGFASKNFYISFAAVTDVLYHRDTIFQNTAKSLPLAFKEIKLKRPTPINSFVKAEKITKQILEHFNPDLSRSFIQRGGTMPASFRVKVPAEQKSVSAD